MAWTTLYPKPERATMSILPEPRGQQLAFRWRSKDAQLRPCKDPNENVRVISALPFATAHSALKTATESYTTLPETEPGYLELVQCRIAFFIRVFVVVTVVF